MISFVIILSCPSPAAVVFLSVAASVASQGSAAWRRSRHTGGSWVWWLPAWFWFWQDYWPSWSSEVRRQINWKHQNIQPAAQFWGKTSFGLGRPVILVKAAFQMFLLLTELCRTSLQIFRTGLETLVQTEIKMTEWWKKYKWKNKKKIILFYFYFNFLHQLYFLSLSQRILTLFFIISPFLLH